LPITHQIVLLHGGTLIPSSSDGFTEFNIELPMADRPQKIGKPGMEAEIRS